MNKGKFNTSRTPFVFNKSGSGSGSGGGGITAIPINQTAFVDDVNGDDVTGQVGRLDLPYKTINQAQTDAGPQTLIYVWPGTYNPTSLGKDNVDFYFSPGVQLTSDAGQSVIATTGFMDTNFYGSAEIDSSAFNGQLISFQHSGGTVYFECKSINQLDGSDAVLMNCLGASARVIFNVEGSVLNSTGSDSTFRILGQGSYYISANEIDNQTGAVGVNQGHAINVLSHTGDELEVRCPKIEKSVTGGGAVVRLRAGCGSNVRIYGNIIGTAYANLDIWGGLFIEGCASCKLWGDITTVNRPAYWGNDSTFDGPFYHYEGIMDSTNYEVIRIHDNRHDSYFYGIYIADNINNAINQSQVGLNDNIYIDGTVINNSTGPNRAGVRIIDTELPRNTTWSFGSNAKILCFGTDAIAIRMPTSQDIRILSTFPANVDVGINVNNIVAGTDILVDPNIN